MQQRQFLLDCDKVMKYAIENGQYRKQVIKNELSLMSDIEDIRSYALKRGHVETKQFLVTNEGREFFRQTSYAEEYDKTYRKEEIEHIEQEDKPNKIIRENKNILIGAGLLLVGILTIILMLQQC